MLHITFPCTVSRFWEILAKEFHSELELYVSKGGDSGCIDAYYQLISVLPEREGLNIDKYLTLIEPKKFPLRRDRIDLNFYNGVIITLHRSNLYIKDKLKYLLEVINLLNNTQSLVQINPNLPCLYKSYIELSPEQKKNYFKHSGNWNNIPLIYGYHKIAKPDVFLDYWIYFDFQNNDAINLFRELWDIHEKRDVDKLHNLSYGTRYFDYMMACDDYRVNLVSDSVYLCNFPFDENNIPLLYEAHQKLHGRSDSAFGEMLLRSMSHHIRFSSRAVYLATIERICNDLKITMTGPGIMEWYSKRYANWDYFPTIMWTFYGAGVVLKTEDELFAHFMRFNEADALNRAFSLTHSVNSYGGHMLWELEYSKRDKMAVISRQKLMNYFIEKFNLEKSDEIKKCIMLFVIWLSGNVHKSDLHTKQMFEFLIITNCRHQFNNGICTECGTHDLCPFCYKTPWVYQFNEANICEGCKSKYMKCNNWHCNNKTIQKFPRQCMKCFRYYCDECGKCNGCTNSLSINNYGWLADEYDECHNCEGSSSDCENDECHNYEGNPSNRENIHYSDNDSDYDI